MLLLMWLVMFHCSCAVNVFVLRLFVVVFVFVVVDVVVNLLRQYVCVHNRTSIKKLRLWSV